MKRFLIVCSAAAFLVAGIAVSQAVSVRADNLMTEAHIQRIRSHCVEAQSTLFQLHASDALLRVNRGQLYESISTKLMKPFNGRLTLNSYDASGLVLVAADYNRQLARFRTDYQQYEELMSKTLKVNCVKQPVAFYDSVAETRTKRQTVHESAVALHDLIASYERAFETFAKDFKESE